MFGMHEKSVGFSQSVLFQTFIASEYELFGNLNKNISVHFFLLFISFSDLKICLTDNLV